MRGTTNFGELIAKNNGSERNVWFVGFRKTIETERCVMFSERVIVFKSTEKVVYFVFEFYYVF